VDAARWTELPGRAGRGLVRDLRGLRGNERLAVAGVALTLISLPLPWYDAEGVGALVQTGLADLNWAQAAMLLTCAATVFLALQVGGGYVPPRPLREWALFAAAGAWNTLIAVYLMVDRPELELSLPTAEIERDYGLGYGIFVALAGSLLILAAGVRARAGASPARSPG
jgi:hypothetical protein